mgnify:CR=1 FL=1
MKNYGEAREYLYGLHKRGIKMGLRNMRIMCRIFDNPQKKFRSVHVAGTNGKGSVACYTASVLRKQGYRTGLYTSPHLLDYTERILVDEDPITRDEILELANFVEDRISAYNESCTDDGKRIAPTFFEVMTMICFLHFVRQKVEVAVLEVGLGGRLDASNVVIPEVSTVITIGLEHENWLGKGLKRIGREKAGVIKKGVPAVIGRLPEEAMLEADRAAEKQGAPLFKLGRDFKLGGKNGDYSFSGCGMRINRLKLDLPGAHQRDNAAIALAMLAILRAKGWEISKESIKSGMERMFWPGRLDRFGNNPPWILDGAHNPAGINALVDTIEEMFPQKRILTVFSFMRDKRIEECVEPFRRLNTDWILTEPAVTRARSVEELFEHVSRLPGKVRRAKKVSAALRLAQELSPDYDLILLCGSLYLIGEAYERVSEKIGRAAESEIIFDRYPPIFLTADKKCQRIKLPGEVK